MDTGEQVRNSEGICGDSKSKKDNTFDEGRHCDGSMVKRKGVGVGIV